MASPDFSQYIDLTIYDLDPYAVYDDAIAYARTSVPDFSPRTGTLEDAIMQAVAYNTGLISSQINRLPNGLMEGIARLSGLERREAIFSTGTVLIEVFDNNGMTIAAGTVVQYESISDDIVTSYAFETTADLVIAVGDTTGSVAIKGLFAGKYPALLSGQALTLVSPAPAVISVELDSTLYVGADAETDTEYFNRAAQHFASLSSVLTTKTQLANYIKSEYTNVPYFGIFDLTSTSDLLWSAGDSAGNVAIVACDPLGAALSSTVKSDLLADLESRCVAGLTLGIADFDLVAITVTCTFALASGYSSLTVRTAIEDYLNARLSYIGYDFSGSIIKNELISSVANIDGVKYVSDITITSADGDFSYASGVVSFAKKSNVPDPTITVSAV